MIQFNNVSLAHGANTLIENINFTIYEKDCWGIIGANGCGKSSLLALIRGLAEPARGSLQMKGDLKISVLTQETPALGCSAIDYTLSGDAKLFAIYERLAEAEKVQDYDKMMRCHNQLSECDGYSAQSKAAKILVGLGFTQEQLYQPVKTFSGGWRMRLNLAKCLFLDSDLMLLDEPTNHLDLEAILWLENYLKYYPGTLIVISHDRDFLDSVVNQIAHIDNQQLKTYKGNYSQFELIRAQNIITQNAQYKKQQAQMAHMMKYVDKNRAKASKAKQAQSRLKAIERMELVSPIYEQSPFSFEFKQPDSMPNPMLKLEKVTLGYGDTMVLEKVDMTIHAGSRIGLLGVNGAGKSTLIKAMIGELKPLHGTITTAPKLSIGYFAQHQVDHLPLDQTPAEILMRMPEKPGEQAIYNYFGGYGFNKEQCQSPIQKFSGGEKSRLSLALIAWKRPNILLLDEPTNHLDLDMRQALTRALQSFEGSMILVSHDRYLLRSLVEELYLIENHRLKYFDGSIDEYDVQRN